MTAPRPDAQPYAWKSLTDDQQGCLKKLLGWFESHLETGSEKREEHFGLLHHVQIDERRPSNVVLIDGARGSGKTSVMLTLLSACSRALRGESAAKGEEIGDLCKLQSGGTLHGRLLPTRILDLQPLSADAPLLTWLSVRILSVLEAIEEDVRGGSRADSHGEPGRWEPSVSKESKARKAWRHFAGVIAGGWDGNLAARKDKLDPEAWVIELERSEQKRSTLQRCWRVLIDELLAAAHGAHPRVIAKDARLVVPIDDADMNPRRSVELLELLRVLWHPRVVFLLTGDSDLFRTTLRVQFEGEFYRVGQRTKFEGELREEVTRKSLALRRESYDKLIPAQHRYALKPLVPDERLRWLLKIQSDARTDVPALKPESAIRSYFDIAPLLKEALPERLRSLHDFHGTLATSADTDSALNFAHALWLDAVECEDLPAAVQQRVVRDQQGLRVDLSGVIFTQGNDVAALDPGAVFCLGQRLVSTPTDDKPALPARAFAALQLCASVAADLALGSTTSSVIAPPYVNFNPVVAAGFLQGVDGDYRFPWPTPSWLTPIDAFVFLAVWEDALARIGSGLRVDDAAQVFVQAIVKTTRSQRWPLPKLEKLPRGEDSWPETLELFAKCIRSKAETPHKRMLRSWALTLAPLLAAPESGLSPTAANRLFDRWDTEARARSKKDSGSHYEPILTMRGYRAGLVWMNRGADIVATLKNFDAQRPAFKWGSHVLSAAQVREREVRDWLAKLRLPNGVTVASIADDLYLLPALCTNNVEDEGRLDAIMSVNPSGQLAKTIAEMWQKALSIERIQGTFHGEQSQRVRVEDGRLLVDVTYDGEARNIGRDIAQVQGNNESETRGAVLSRPSAVPAERLAFVRRRYPWYHPRGSEVAPALLIIAREVAIELDEKNTFDVPHDTRQFVWIRRRVEGLSDFYAEGPSWPTLHDEMRELRMWEIATAPLWTSRGMIDRDQFESAVGAYIECVLSLDARSETPVQMSRDITAAYWRALGARIAERITSPSTSTPRAQAVTRWCCIAVPLLAAPEGMLWPASGRALLDTLGEFVDVDAMHACRRKLFLGVPAQSNAKETPKEKARALLAAVAAKEPENAWLKRFGETTFPADVQP